MTVRRAKGDSESEIVRQVVRRGLLIFLIVCATGTFALLAVFAQFRFGQDNTYHAEFKDVSGLKTGDMVRIAGVEVGKVDDITVRPDLAGTARVVSARRYP